MADVNIIEQQYSIVKQPYREIHCTSCGFKDLDEIYNTDSTGTIITGVNYLLNI